MWVGGGGQQPRRHFGGSWQGGWWNGCADKVEWWRAGRALLANRRSLSLSLLTTPWDTVHQTVGAQLESGPELRKGTTTTAPNHPHNTHSLHGVKGLGMERTARDPGKHRVTQADRHVCGWGWRSVPAHRAGWAWRKHPTDTSGGTTPGGGWNRSPDGPGTPARPLEVDRSDRGACGRDIHAKMDVGADGEE